MTTIAHRHANQAISAVITAYALYSTGDMIAKFLSPYYNPPLMLVCNGAILCGISLALIIRGHSLSRLWETPRLHCHFARAVVVGLLSLLAMTVVKYIPLADFYGIIFMTPFLSVLIARYVFSEEIGWHRMLAIVIGFSGILILAQPAFAEFNIGYALALIVVLFMAAHVVIVRRIACMEPGPLLTFYPGLGMLCVGIPLLIAHPQIPAPEHFPLLGLYGLTLWLGQLYFARAFTLTPLTSIIAPYLYTQMFWGILYGYFIFGTVPHTMTFIGGAIVIGSGLFMVLMDRRIRRRRLLGGTVPAAG